MGTVIDFATRETHAVPQHNGLCPQYRAYCALSDELADRESRPAAHRTEHKRRWLALLGAGTTENELDRLSKELGR